MKAGWPCPISKKIAYPPMISAPPLTIQDLTYTVDERIVFDHLSLVLRAGEILGIAGQNCADVSILLKVIRRQISPEAGQIQLLSEPHGSANGQSYLAYLPEELQTPGHLTGCDVVNMARTVQGQVESPIEDIASDLDLPLKRLKYPTRDYTREDMQKLALLALLAMNRPILLLDQPMSHLDETAKAGLQDCLKRHADKGGAALLGSPCVEDLEGVTDRLMTLEDGKLYEVAMLHPTSQDELVRAI